MKAWNKAIILLALVAAAGCSDDSKNKNSNTCEVTACKDSQVLNRCDDGFITEVTCGLRCENDECIEKCTSDICDGDVLLKCEDGEVKPTDCPNGCYIDHCATYSECKPNTTKCDESDENYIMNCIDGAWERAESPCELGCNNGVCMCKNGDIKCEGEELLTCSDNIWQREPCPYGCEIIEEPSEECHSDCPKSICKNCKDGDKKCKDKIVMQCADGVWTSGEVCDIACSNGECRNCTENAEGCIDNYNIVCKDNAWQTTVCENACDESCENGQPGKCAAGASGCVGGTDLITCEKGRWKTEICEKACVEGNCIACNDGDYKCSSRLNKKTQTVTDVLSVCNEGVWEDVKDCPAGCSDGFCKECQDGASKCAQGFAQICTNQTWQTQVCAYGCSKNKCRVCEENTSECVNDHEMRTCTGNKWTTISCEGGCETTTEGSICHGCVEGSQTCQDKKTKKYCEDNTWKTQNCPLGCESADCVSCEVGTQRCEDGWMIECTGDNWKDLNKCEHGCYNDKVCNTCVVNTKSCDGKKIVQCMDNQWKEIGTCKNLCHEGECLNNCVDGSKKCGTGPDNVPAIYTCKNDNWETDIYSYCTNQTICAEFPDLDKVDCTTTCTTEGQKKYNCVPISSTNPNVNSSEFECTKTKTGLAYAKIKTVFCGTNECTEAAGCKSCENGQTMCNGNNVYECKDEQWGFKKSCIFSCAGGACENQTCSAGEKMCKSTYIVYSCGNSGEWVITETCQENKDNKPKCNEAGKCICIKDKKRCQEDNAYICDDNGDWVLHEECPYGCDEGVCLASQCTDGQTKCNGNQIQNCNGGRWENGPLCQSGCQGGHCI